MSFFIHFIFYQIHSVKSWMVLSVHESKSSAQEVETREAKLQNCEAHPGGRGFEFISVFVLNVQKVYKQDLF